MSLVIKIICPEGIITASDNRETYSTIDRNGLKKTMGFNDCVQKSFLKNNCSIAVAGNAYIGDKQLKDFLPEFLSKLADNIKYDELLEKISSLYSKPHMYSTNYYFSFYDNISEHSNYKNYFKFEPFVFHFDTFELKSKRLNEDEDGFTYGVFWGGEVGLISEALEEKRKKINTNEYNIERSIEKIKSIFKEVEDEFQKENKIPTISSSFDLTIQTPAKSAFYRKYKG